MNQPYVKQYGIDANGIIDQINPITFHKPYLHSFPNRAARRAKAKRTHNLRKSTAGRNSIQLIPSNAIRIGHNFHTGKSRLTHGMNRIPVKHIYHHNC